MLKAALLFAIIASVTASSWWQVRARMRRERDRPRREVLADVAISTAGAVIAGVALIVGFVRPL